ncbi:MAG: lipid-A-disaccharide synthase N-terminal domain-containing protein [Alphaproteobacteria bacterium]
MAGETIFVWLVIGFLAQGLFFMRFFVQWIASERQRRSIIPVAFWYFSLAGGTTLLAYAIHRQDPVFIVGQGAGLIIYSRNLYFIWRRRGEESAAG